MVAAAAWFAIDVRVRYPSPNWVRDSNSSPISMSSMVCRTLVSVSSNWGPIAADDDAVPMVSAAMPISPHTLVNRSRANSPE